MERAQAAIVGGGPAGLQAALTLGRMHVRSVVFDDGRYRNATSARIGNVTGHDGAAPADLRSAIRAELRAYPWVRIDELEVTAIRRRDDGFHLVTADGPLVAERVLIASGAHDALLPVDGLAELWGDLVLPCPYCHGHEFAGGPIAVISSGGHADHVGALLRGITDVVPVLDPVRVRRVRRAAAGVAIELQDGGAVDAACVFIPPNAEPRSALAEGLGARVGERGILVDALGRTSATGVWAAGDVAERPDPRIPASIVAAMASGLAAAADIASDVAAPRDAAAGRAPLPG